LLIPYLNRGNYVGIEPNQWLVDEGIKREIGADSVRIKSPKFYYSDSPKALTDTDMLFDFAVAQSVFSHCGLNLITDWLAGVSLRLSSTGALLATFLLSAGDFKGEGWVYPACVSFTSGTLNETARKAGLSFEILDWMHPRQTWGLFAKPGFDTSFFKGKPLTWNTRIDWLSRNSPVNSYVLWPRTAERR
jgi:hypothetical protein